MSVLTPQDIGQTSLAMGSALSSKITDSEWKYPLAEPRRTGMMNVSDRTGHSLYWEEYGNPLGTPVVVLHGGPGGNSAPIMSRFFNPDRYRVVLFDQRGCGKSVPNGNDDEPMTALANNTTPHLIRDIMQLRQEVRIGEKMILFGGSWGGTLALATAIAHPNAVDRLVLRSTFLGRRKDVDYLYQGNAANPANTRVPGAYKTYPEDWKDYLCLIPPSQRRDMVAAYAAIVLKSAKTPAEQQRQIEAGHAWMFWQINASHSIQEPPKDRHDFALSFARMEIFYFRNGSFLGGSGEVNRDNNYLLNSIRRIRNIPVDLVHGERDEVCPISEGKDLLAALQRTNRAGLRHEFTNAGHSMLERENCLALTRMMDTIPLIAPRRSIPILAMTSGNPSFTAVAAEPA